MSLASGRASSRPRTAVLCGILLLWCWFAPDRMSWGAEDPDADFSLKETVQVGPFHMAPFFMLKDFGYDDNTRLDASRSSGDFMLTFGPGARAVAPVGRLAAFSIWDEIDYAVFAKESDLNHVNNSLRTKLHLYLRDFTLYADGEQNSTRERPNTEIDFRIRSTATAGKFGTTWNPGSRGKIDLYLRRVNYHYAAGQPDLPAGSDPNAIEQAAETANSIAAQLERNETGIGLTGSMRIRPRTSALLDLRTGRIDFANSVINGALLQRDSASHSVMGGLEFDPAGSLRGFFKVGVRHLAPDNPKLEGFNGLIADASLSARLLGRGEARAVYQRDTGFSTVGDNLFFIYGKKALAYEHFLSSRVSLELGRQLETVDYPVPIQVTPGNVQHRRDDIVTDKVTFRYRLGPSLRVGLSVGRWNRDSTVDLVDTSRNTITTLLEYTP